jgi:GNAT superfamily N-acetyltransferase
MEDELDNNLIIQNAGATDHVELARLYKQLQPDDPPLDPKEYRRNLARLSRFDGSAIFLGRLDDAAVATCTLVVIPNLTRGGAPYALIENVVTDTAHRKRGLGKAILEHAIAAAWRHGCYKVMLLTGSKRPETLEFYGEAGFEQNKTGFQIRAPAGAFGSG